MNFEQLEYVVKIANEGSISKAAEKLHISPSGISQAISHFERELEVIIFNRSRGGITLTLEGEIVLSKSLEILNNLKDLKDELTRHRDSSQKHIKIACAPTFTYIMHDVLVKFSVKNDDVTFELDEQNTTKIIKNFTKNGYDLAFVAASKGELEKENNLHYEFLDSGIICIVVGKNSPLYHLDYVTADELNHQKVVMYNFSNKDFLQLAKKFKNEIVLKSNRTLTLIEIIKESPFFTFVHNTTIKNFPEVLNGELKVLPIKDNDQDYFKQDFWVVSPNSNSITNACKEFIEYVKKILTFMT